MLSCASIEVERCEDDMKVCAASKSRLGVLDCNTIDWQFHECCSKDFKAESGF